jgi:hypothetical protein
MANIKVNIDVDSGDVSIASDKVLTLQQQIKILRQELQKTPEGTKEFNLLVTKLNDTQDAFSRVNIKGKEIFGTLGLIPGPIGEIAARTNSALDALKVFGSFSANDVKAQFVALKDDFIGAGKALANLTGITSVYTATLNRFTTAAGAASTGAKVLAASIATIYTALGIGVIMAVVYAFSKLESSEETVKKSVDATTESIKKQNEAFEYNKKLAASNSKILIDEMKLQGFSEKEIREKVLRDALQQQIRANKALTEIRIKYNENEIELLRLQGKSEYGLEETNIARKKEAATKNKGILGKEIDDRKLAAQEANANLLDLQVKYFEEDKQKREDAFKATKAQRDKDLEDIKKNAAAAQMAVLEGRTKELTEVDKKYGDQIDLAKKYGKDTTALEEARRVERKRINAKYDEDEAKNAAEFAKKLGDITVASILNDLEQQKAARKEKYNEDLRNLERDKEFIKLSEEAKNVYRQQLRQAADQDIVEIEDKASQELFDRKLKALQLEGEGLVKGTKSYYDNKRAIIDASEKNELNDLKISFNQQLIDKEEFERQKANIEAKYAQQRKDLNKLELNDYLTFATQILGAINGVFSMASTNLKLEQDRDIANAEGNKEKIEEIKKKGFEDNKKIQIAQAIIGTLQSAVQSFQSLAVIPFVGPALGAAAAAAALIFGYKQVALIKQQSYVSSSSSSSSSSGASAGGGSASSPAFSAPSIGAPQIGPTSAQEGTISGIVAGGIISGNSKDRPLRAYVVGNDITSEQQLQRRLKAAARLGG